VPSQLKSISVPRLIINADDFGLTSGVNRAIAEAGRARAITSATLMANSQAFAEAVQLAKAVPGLGTGCHIVLIDGKPVSSGLHSLTNGGPEFKSNLRDFALAAIRKRLSQEEIQREAEAQIRKMQSAGISVTHVDTHKHTHIFPHVLRPVLKAAKACGIRAIRNPFEPFKAWPAGAIAGRPFLWKRCLEVALLQKFAAAFRQAIIEEGMITTDGATGVIATGSLSHGLLLAMLDVLPEGTWELVCHPGYVDSDLGSAGTRLVESRHVELEALLSRQTREALARRGVQLISYADLKDL
jgi:hopanoid biosynthesis associated protein HpnK